MVKAFNKQVIALLLSWELHSRISRLHYDPILGVIPPSPPRRVVTL